MFSLGGKKHRKTLTRRNRHGKSRKGKCRKGGTSAIGQAIVPFGLFALSNYLGKGKKHGTKKGMRRKTARRAYKKK
tara:strand:- start:3947 stop:4174 length:228 start_codon:yes stop_codon:yes gene_type:complete